MPLHYIYKITNKTNGKMYIGRSKSVESRFYKHIRIAETFSESDNHFQAIHGAIKKYGKENFIFDIIEECSEENANERESYWINQLKTQNKSYGYNLTSGGDGVLNRSEESKAKWLAKMLGRHLSEEHKQKISESNKGKIISEEVKQKISKANSGENNGMFDNTHSLKTREKMSISQSRRLNRDPLTEEHKQRNRSATQKQDFSYRIPKEIKEQVVPLYSSGKFTKKQIAEKLGLKYNSVVKIIRTA